jgi:hypothetical protein
MPGEQFTEGQGLPGRDGSLVFSEKVLNARIGDIGERL